MLAEFAARLIFQFAVRGRTWAGMNALNSPIDPISGLFDENTAWSPVIAIYSDDSEVDVRGQELSGAGGKSGLTVSIYVPPTAVLTMGDETIELQGRGPLAMFTIDMIGYQIRQALVDPANPWGRLWSRFVPSVKKITLSPPFLEEDRGVRIPCRAMVIEYTPLADPIVGRPMTETWQALYDLMMEDPTLQTLAAMLKTAIETPGDIPDWSRVMMTLGLSDATAESAGVRPLEPNVAEGVDPPVEINVYGPDDEPPAAP